VVKENMLIGNIGVYI